MILITLSFAKFGCKFFQYISKVHDEISNTQCRSDVVFLSIFNTLKLSSSYLHSSFGHGFLDLFIASYLAIELK